MLSRFSNRVPAVAGKARRSLITQPTVLAQGEGCVPIFLNPPTKPDLEFGEALRSKCVEKGVDLDYVDLRMFQIKQENVEFEAPALPREQSKCWGYLWGNRLVKNQVLLETLKAEDDYLRGYLTQFTNEHSRKMKIHYPNVDVEGRKSKCLTALKSSPSDFEKLYQEAKIDALSDYIRDDTDGYLGLYKNNSYISSYDDGDTFGYDIPAAMEAKLEGLMQLDWDKDSSTPDVTPYVKMIAQLTDAMQPKLAKMNPKLGAAIQGMLKSSMSSSTAELSALVAVLKKTAASMCGECPEKPEDAVVAILKSLKAAGALKAEDAGAVVQAFRGVASPSEAATLKGKSDDDLAKQFNDVSQKRLAALYSCANFMSSVNDKNVSALLVSGLFANSPMSFTQFAMDEANVASFLSTNGAAFDAVADSVGKLGPVTDGVSKSMTAANAGVQKWLQSTLTLDKAGLDSVVAELPALMSSCGKSQTPWMAKAAAKAAKNATGLDLVEASTLAKLFSSPKVADTPAMKFYNTVFGGGCMKGVAAACSSGSFADDLGEKLAASLVASGKATPAQAEVVKSKIGSVEEMKAFTQAASKAAEAYDAVDDALLGVKWCVEPVSIPSLMMAYQSLPHPSFSNVNSY